MEFMKKVPLIFSTVFFDEIKKIMMNLYRLPEFYRELKQFRNLSAAESQRRFLIRSRDLYPCLDDKTSETPFDTHYVYHVSWAARILERTKPGFHVDISSLLYFSTVVSAFTPVLYLEFRAARLNLTNFSSGASDIHYLPFKDGSIKSLSCMHAVEHIGLGRYGDQVDPQGDIKAILELKRVLSPNGDLLFVVPIGSPRIMFNAHRIYSYRQIRDYFKDFELVEFALVPDNAYDRGIVSDASETYCNEQVYSCGCFWFRKSQVMRGGEE